MASWFDWVDPKNLPAAPSVNSLTQSVEDLVNLTLGRTLRLAVTGLRQSGKTVFITTLVHHLLSGQELPFFTPIKQKRLLGVRLLPPAPGDPPSFPLSESRDRLTHGQPSWPEPTHGLSSLRLELRVANASFVARQLGDYRSQQVQIIDYPGEWLLDLPMLEQSFEEWSEAMLRLAISPERSGLAKDWLQALNSRSPSAGGEHDRAVTLAAHYQRYLELAQAAGFSMLQPGRMTMPGDLRASVHLHFCPMPPDNSKLYTIMSDRYEHYRDQWVRPFYTDHFSRFDRQIVLVDLLGSLNHGRAVFSDTQDALNTVLKSFRYGTSGLISRLFSPKIETLLFACSKADHVAHNQHHNLRLMLEQMVLQTAGDARFEGVQPVFMALSSHRSTDVVKANLHGQVLSCVRGHLKGENRETVVFPGEIPPHLPVEEDWEEGRFRFRSFAPRRLQLSGARQPQHIRLDQALEVLIGDRLQ